MKFCGNGIVWDVEINKPLCKFINNIFETNDENIINKLEKLGYKKIEELIPIENMEWQELKQYAKRKGINTHKMKKEEIINILEEEVN